MRESQFSALKNSPCVIVANGAFLPIEMIQDAARDKRVIALDGAAAKLVRHGIVPFAILGDFDSLSPADRDRWGIQAGFDELTEDALPYWNDDGVLIVPQKNQNATDLVKAIRYLDTLAVSSIEVLCAMGCRLDHMLANLRALKSEYKKERPLKLHSEKETLTYIKNDVVTFYGDPGDYCGIVAFPKARFSSVGLKYNGEAYPLDFALSESTSNQLIAHEARIEVEGEALLIAPGELASHQKFKALSYEAISSLVLSESGFIKE